MKARRGDLAVIVTDHHVTGQTGDYDDTRVEITTVTSVTRNGEVKAVQPVYGAALPLAHLPGAVRHVLLVKREDIDVEAAMNAARAHTWPGHPDQPMPFASVAEARDAIAPARITAGVS